MSTSTPPCNPAGALPLSASECDCRCPATSMQIWLRHTPSNRDNRSPSPSPPPPGPALLLLLSLWTVMALLLLLPPTGDCIFRLPPEGGGRTVALAPNPPVSPPIAGPRRHLPPQRRSCRGSSVSKLAKMEDLLMRVYFCSPKIWLIRGDELNKWQLAERWPSDVMNR